MKKIFFTLAIMALTLSFVACDNDDNKTRRIDFSEVPETAKTFLTKHFANFSEDDIMSVEVDEDDYGTYEVKFKNLTEITFYSNGVWKEIDLNGNPLSESIVRLIPENALTYISSMYPNAIIEEIEKTEKSPDNPLGFKIELKNDRDIYFDLNGDVIRDKGEGTEGKKPIELKDLEDITKDFLNTYFEGLTPKSIEKEWNKIEVEYNGDIEVEFFAKDGSFKSIEAENNPELMRNVIKGIIGSTAILDYLDKNHQGQVIEEFSVAAAGITIKNGGYVVELDGRQDYKVYFDKEGNYVATVND